MKIMTLGFWLGSSAGAACPQHATLAAPNAPASKGMRSDLPAALAGIFFAREGGEGLSDRFMVLGG